MSAGEQEVKAEMEARSDEWDPDVDVEEPDDGPEPELEWAYGTLWRLTRMAARGYTNLLMLDAPGGIGKTYNVKKVLEEECESDDEDTIDNYYHKSGFTTPVELYKSLYRARHGAVLFLDDMSGIAGNTKAVNMLKAATDTGDDPNWVEYNSSQSIEDDVTGQELPQQFVFRGTIIMSFNETPDGKHFDALRDRGQDYELDFTYDERIKLIREVAKSSDISSLPYEQREETVDWIETVTDESIEVTIRTLRNVLEIREFAEDVGGDWERDAIEVFDLDYHRFLIVKMRKNPDEYGESIEQQVEHYKEKTGMSERHYYDKWAEVRDQMNV